jgi:serine/threonine protein kinase/CubicO group peptidase (beta-lactamase class C family)
MANGEEGLGRGGADPPLTARDDATLLYDSLHDVAKLPIEIQPLPGAVRKGVASLQEFSQTLIDLGLSNRAELEQFSAHPDEGVLGLSRALVRAGKLTAYQAAAIYQQKSRGLLVGNYLILDKLGQGGMGVVFLARHRTLGRLGALKILPPSFSRDQNAVLRFRREIEAAGRVKHKNLVAAFDADEDRGVHFLGMDYVVGRDLDRVVDQQGPLSLPVAVDYLIQAARGLEAAHAQGIIHRDIKPGNLMLDNAGTVHVLDLGLARLVDASNPFNKTAAGRLTQSGMYMGTVDFMAREQAEDSHRVDHRADIYSLGCTLFYLLTGRAPFPGDTVLKRLMAHMERPAPSLRTFRPDVPVALDAAYQRMMAKQPDDRPASMTEVIELLQASKLPAADVARDPARPPKSKPELMVFNEAPLNRSGSLKTELDPLEPAGLQEREVPFIKHELKLEDLAIDVRSEVPPVPADVWRSPALERAESLKHAVWALFHDRRWYSAAALGVLAIVGLVAVIFTAFMGDGRLGVETDHARLEATREADEAQPDESIELLSPSRPDLNVPSSPSALSPADSLTDSGIVSPSNPEAPKPATPAPASPTPTSPKPTALKVATERPRWIILSNKHSYFARNISQEAFNMVGELAKKDEELKSIGFAPGGGWAILHGKNGYKTKNIPAEAQKTLHDLAERGEELKSIAFTPDGGWTILFGENGNLSQGIPDEAFETLKRLTERDVELKSVAYGPNDGWAILFDRNGFVAGNIPDEARKTLGAIATRGEELKSTALGPHGGWVILYGRNGYSAHGISEEAQERLGRAAGGGTIKSFTFVVRPEIPLSSDDEETRNRVMARMAYFNVPGLGIALVNNFRMEWARGYGVVREGDSQPVTTETIFRAASLSKPVTALAALCLVQRGKLELDRPLNDKLTSWKVPDNEFTRRNKPTLRQLLNHSAGFTDRGYAGYPYGARFPTLVEILDGKRPANSPPVRVRFLPGSKHQYSGAGYLVLQQLIVDVTGKPFSDVVRELVLAPLGMDHSGFQQPPPSGLHALAAIGHDHGTPIPGGWRIYPELAAAGLWTTPSDLARFVIAMLDAKQGNPGAIITKDLAAEMLRKQSGSFGLGLVVRGAGPSSSFDHEGEITGFACRLIGFPETGQGAVLMTNGDRGSALIDELEQSLRAEYGWPG